MVEGNSSQRLKRKPRWSDSWKINTIYHADRTCCCSNFDWDGAPKTLQEPGGVGKVTCRCPQISISSEILSVTSSLLGKLSCLKKSRMQFKPTPPWFELYKCCEREGVPVTLGVGRLADRKCFSSFRVPFLSQR